MTRPDPAPPDPAPAVAVPLWAVARLAALDFTRAAPVPPPAPVIARLPCVYPK